MPPLESDLRLGIGLGDRLRCDEREERVECSPASKVATRVVRLMLLSINEDNIAFICVISDSMDLGRTTDDDGGAA